MQQIAVDIGGTFTDLVAKDDAGRLTVSKVLTTPEDHAEGVMHALDRANADIKLAALFLHGSTVAINTVVERKGANTALLTTRGFRDVYEIGRSNRPDAYNLFFERPVPLVPRSRRLEVTERMTARGEVHTPLNLDEAATVVAALRDAGVESIAVCLLHSYANPAHEEALGEIVASVHPSAYVTLSHRVLREYREYERTSTTAMNAYVGPVVARYIASLETRLKARGFSGEFLIMHSGGGVMPIATAIQSPVRMMESGPVAGVIGAAGVARALGYRQAIAFDMGGTTAKTSLTRNGDAEIAGHYYIGGYNTGQPVMLPVVDIVEVGSGGGSIAWLDAAGALKVGPISAGAKPGPACYGRGGSQPTVTDANLILGRIAAESFLGGELRLDHGAAANALRERIAVPLDLDVESAAIAMLRIVNAQMSLALRAVSLEKGQDPRDYAMVAFGGAGPLHACELARELNMPAVIVPELPGQFSACGMLTCELRSDHVQTLVRDFATVDPGEITMNLQRLIEQGVRELRKAQTNKNAELQVNGALDLRYLGQEYTVTVPLLSHGFAAADRECVAGQFHGLYESLYGHATHGEPLELVALRATVRRAVETRQPANCDRRKREPSEAVKRRQRRVYMGERFGFLQSPVYHRSQLCFDGTLDGPAIIEETASTTVVLPGDKVRVAAGGELVIQIAHDTVGNQ